MKKATALLLVLCLLCAGAAALAETAEATRLELDGFTLELNSGEYYETYEKSAGQIYAFVCPFFSSGDVSQNYCFYWDGAPFEMTEEEAKARIPEMEEELRAGLEDVGFSLISMSVDDIYEAELNGMPCVVTDLELSISAFGTTVTTWEREIMIGSLGYLITISAASPDELEEITGQLAYSLDFN